MDGQRDLSAEAAFEPEPTAVADARRFVRKTLISWGLSGRDDLVADAVLLASELVTNAIVHAGTPVQLTCRLDGATVEVSVLDRHPARVIPDPPGAAAEVDRPSGRGLLLPAALSSSWGVTYAPAAKVIWFRLGPDGADGHAASGPTVDEVLAAGHPDAGVRAPGADQAARDLLTLSYDELLAHAVSQASEAVAADAAYALIADEGGELRMRAAAGRGVAQLHGREGGQMEAAAAVPGPAAGAAGMDTFLELYTQFAERGADLAQVQNEPLRSLLTVPFQAQGRVTGMLAVAAAEPDRFAEADLARVQQVADAVALPLERARLSEHDRIRRARLSFLAEASDLLAGTLDQEKTIALAAQLVVPRLAAWCAALVPDEDGELRPAYVWHADESSADVLAGLLSAAPPPRVAPGDGAQPWSFVETPELSCAAAAELAADPAWCFPLVARDRSLGVFVIGRPREGALAQESVELAADLTRRVALALDNARLYSAQRQANDALQRSLLPPELPAIPGVDLAAGYEAAGEGNEVGGDFYDVFEVAPGRWRFAIGDVCGKGPEAAAVTGLTRHALRILAREGHDVPTVVERLNALIVDEGSRAPFVTLIHGELAPASSSDTASGDAAVISLVCAGHPPPLVLRSAGDVEAVAEPQSLLGVLDGVTFEQNVVRLSPRDVLLCVTDGVTERRSGDHLLDDGDGLRGLLGECSGLTAGSVVARIQRAVREFGSGPPTDDVALLVFRALQV
ncbi:MAG TPA: SpoIIE family protein phosphatase [Streptosporangiaceae bacterium]|nr:SpoIIE family protein phosphatase [Streptosporangiaceae bacterium]